MFVSYKLHSGWPISLTKIKLFQNMSSHCPPGPLGGVQVPAPVSMLYLVLVRCPCFPNIFHFEVVLIYLHCWLSTTTKEVNPFKSRPIKSVENKYKILFQVAGPS